MNRIRCRAPRLIALMTAVFPISGACTDGHAVAEPPDAQAPNDDATDEGDADATAGSDDDTKNGDDEDDTSDPGDPTTDDAVDLLLVLDNSGSMGTKAARLALEMPTLLTELAESGMSVRLGITTTDVLHPLCQNTAPENGTLRLSSCLVRGDDFVFDPTGEALDVFHVGCADFCTSADVSTTPTTTESDQVAKARDWIEIHSDGSTNLAGVDTFEDLVEPVRCVVPQGINGCGFESPLEAVHLAVQRAADPSHTMFEFRRSFARFVALIVTDEYDCSHDPAARDIFTDETSPFWHPEAGLQARSSICWRAQAQCEGTGNPYDRCEPVNHDIDAHPGVADGEAVLWPLSRYRPDFDAERSMLFGIVGVPQGYANSEVELAYFAGDETEEVYWGIAPACTVPDGGVGGGEQAVPPLRMRALAEELSEQRTLYSICAEDYRSTMTNIAAQILRRFAAH
ncbi:MAG: hypothetical protein B7733_24630 [Myxococcales bacterium FL481]|nr:MAG: hypothetical protein B7733_24630 [Myxococcales bacterium FL481]